MNYFSSLFSKYVFRWWISSFQTNPELHKQQHEDDSRKWDGILVFDHRVFVAEADSYFSCSGLQCQECGYIEPHACEISDLYDYTKNSNKFLKPGWLNSKIVAKLIHIFVNSQAVEKIYSQITKPGKDEKCAICYDEFEDDSEVLLLPCQHFFCRSCILSWIPKNNSCPTCRAHASLRQRTDRVFF